jgi:lysyl endopeptidase
MTIRHVHSAICSGLLVAALVVLPAAAPARATTITGYGLDVPTQAPPPSVAGLEPGSVAGVLQPLVELDDLWSARSDDLVELARRNAAGGGRTQIGVTRPLTPMSFAIPVQGPNVDGTGGWRIVRTEQGVVWGTRLRVEAAHALRLRIALRSLPPASQIWLMSEPGVGGRSRISGPHSTKRIDARGELLLPPVSGPGMGLEIHIPLSSLPAAGTEIDLLEIVEVVDLDSPAIRDLTETVAREQTGRGGVPWENCAVDGTCITSGEVAAIANLREAVARISFQSDGVYYACSATLIADNARSGTPYLLTAEHCLATQAAANTLVAYFDFRTSSCNGTAPAIDDVPQVNGADLLAFGETSDVTLLRLDGLPTGQVYFMGWTTEDPTSGTIMHSLTHPAGRPQRYAAHSLIAPGDPTACSLIPQDHYHYGALVDGSTTSGSSGGGHIVDVDGGLLVGQHKGFCSPVPIEDIDLCDPTTFDALIGAMSYGHPLLEPWLGSPVSTPVFEDGFESGSTTNWTTAIP